MSLFEGWPDLVCFDLDGTLIDSVPDISKALDIALQSVGAAKAGEERARAWVGFGSSKLVSQALEWSGISIDTHESCHSAFLKAYFESVSENTTLYPNVEALLKAFKYNGVPMALITNKPSVFVKPILEHFGLSDYFSWQLGGDTLEEKKPSPVPLLHCSESIEAAPERCLMIGDSVADARAAQAANFKSVLVSYGYNHGIELSTLNPDVVIDDLAELLM
ncbi:phosphoglycolate phosphatase [Marinomonas mediterranea]|jgi:phosphoglycolate phosphatase|uniref:Phosphoglycolate phosphatase n=1 Tax=Marinomonas mediterranea (strain ATCC 700492 / JCM 21426 / NBRC 103028 / MMB-1) TaxID=717774 RepID=F2JT82_MARM1|nr:phosphoglycolate phosphatase [Marinomonas mediterranea]ADZ90300.1 phosphoglycolate phosphatase [Marinomonas mediterranea MMB-1]